MGLPRLDHCDAWKTTPAEFEASVVRNRRKLEELLPGQTFATLSYPISWPRPQTKRRIARHFDCARGGGQTFNPGTMDLNFLKAFFIEQCRGDYGQIEQVLAANARAKGWLIFATHDVCDSPTRFGCTPQFFARVVEGAIASGAAVLPVQQALRRLSPAASENASEGQLSCQRS